MAQNHVEELDGCDHGATGKACKADPSTNGQDCEVHGNHGGVNEDHCLTSSSTTSTTATTTTTATTIGTTTTTTAPVPATTTTTSGTATTPTVLATPPSSEAPSVVSVSPGSALVSTVPASGRELPRTGASTFDALSVGLGLVIAGLILRRRAGAMRRG
jgi:LPXTG-motif cell wall-anchored protein